MKYVSAYQIFYKVVNAIRSGVEVVKELDSAMTEMKKVTKESQYVLDDFAKSSHKIAQEIGSTASVIQNSAADWMGKIPCPVIWQHITENPLKSGNIQRWTILRVMQKLLII
jgi:hypothetical protein